VADQVLHPDADLADGAWLTDAAGTTLYAVIDEATVNDSDFIRSALGPSLDTARFSFEDYGFGDLIEPLRLQYRFDHEGAAQSLLVRLMQGTFEIASRWQETADALQTYELTLTPEEFALVTDISDLRVELIAGFDPLKLFGSDLIGWYDANEGTYSDLGVTPATIGDPVRQWNDKSSYGNHLTNSGSGERPTVIGTFSGLHKGLSCDANTLNRSNVAINSAAVSVFVACQVVESAGNSGGRIFSVTGSVNDWQSVDGFSLSHFTTMDDTLIVEHNGLNTLLLYSGGSGALVSVAADEPFVAGAIVKTDSIRSYINGQLHEENTALNTPAFDATNIVAVSNGAATGKNIIAEVIFVKREAIADEIKKLQTYLKYKHGLYLNPLQLYGSNVVAWYKASEAYSDAGITPAVHGEQIIQLNDLSPNGYHLTKETGKEPSFTSEFNDQYPGMIFTGVPTVGGDVVSRANLNFTGPEAAAFFVGNMDGAGTWGRWLELDNPFTLSGFGFYREGTSPIVKAVCNGSAAVCSYTTADNVDYIWGGTFKTNAVRAYLNNAASALSTDTFGTVAFDATNTFRLGDDTAANPHSGGISEVVLLKSAPSPAELVPLNCYLALSNGIPLTPLEIFGADVVAWYSAKSGVYSDAGSTPAANTDSVQQWNDKSGNNYHLSEATDKPVFTAAGFNGGYPGVAFTAANADILRNTSFNASSMNAGLAMFAVCQFSELSESYSRLMSIVKTGTDYNSSDGIALLRFGGTTDFRGQFWGSESFNSPSGSYDTPAIFGIQMNPLSPASRWDTYYGDNQQIMKFTGDYSASMALASGSTFAVGANAVGSSVENTDGIFGEVLVLKTVPTRFQWWLLRQWFNSEWDL